MSAQVIPLHPYQFGPEPRWEGIPDRIRDGLWCVWQAKPKKNNPQKFDKVPSNGVNDFLASTAPQLWLTFDQAYQVYLSNPGKYNGVGKLVRVEDNLIYGDEDDLDPLTLEQQAGAYDTYVEVSPSGKGLRIISEGQVSRDIGEPMEVYGGNTARFVTITGNVVQGHTVVKDIAAQMEQIVQSAPPPVEVDMADMPPLLAEFEIAAGITEIKVDSAPGGRSNEFIGKLKAPLLLGFTPEQVFSAVWYMPDVSDYLLSKRDNNEAKALKLLWHEVCKAAAYVKSESPDQVFDVIATPTTQPDLQPGQVSSLQLTDWEDLENEYFEPIDWLVDDFLPPGVTMLVGKPKFGKSWLVHAIMLRVAAGMPVFGHEGKQAKCAYFALEDSHRRLQHRTKILMKSMKITPNMIKGRFKILTECERLGDGLEEQLRDLLARTPDLRLMVIDVLARIRMPRGKGDDLFTYDYAVGKVLKNICDDYPELSIVLVHHARKFAVDSSEATSGTNGLNAGMDNVLVLMKGDDGNPALFIHARDVENDDPIPLERGGDGMWTLASREQAEESNMSDTRRAIIDAIDAGATTPQDIVHHTGFEKGTVDAQLYRMVRGDLIKRTGRGQYARVFTDVTDGSELTDQAGPVDHETPYFLQ